jgi:hypothetical protein
MMNRKLILYGIIIILFSIIVIYITGYRKGYVTCNINRSLQRDIARKIDTDHEDITIEDKVKVDDTLIVYFTVQNDRQGYRIYHQGINICYQGYQYGTAQINPEIQFYENIIVTTNKHKYAVIFAKNDQAYTKIIFEVEGIIYEVPLPDTKYFIVGAKVSPNIEYTHGNFNPQFE